MCNRRASVVSLAGACLIVLSAQGMARATDTYQVDSVHSSVIFRVKHMNAAYFYGRFNEVSGAFSIDSAEPSKSSFDVKVKVESIDSKNSGRDKHLKGPDFFNSKQFPEIAFKSKSVAKKGDNQYEVTGDLTMHGETKSVTVLVEMTGSGKGRDGGSLMGVEAVFTVKRSDFGMNFMQGPLGDEIKLMVSLEGGSK